MIAIEVNTSNTQGEAEPTLVELLGKIAELEKQRAAMLKDERERAVVTVLAVIQEFKMSARELFGHRKKSEPHQTPVIQTGGGYARNLKLEEVRRGNFRLLTAWDCAKRRLAKLSGLSAANISHRVSGEKIFDAETATFFCRVLRLPGDWFEVPRCSTDIPDGTMTLLRDDTTCWH